ncbi:uncharacterized protein LOC142238464 isoform X1 [Haematobia irritans]|uniref:uncharacterized protein LOC142220127 isoform X1 n=1 Tax=Haematobia irritans TaxID=7368 RepID=UPI003F4FDDCD
MYVCFQHCHSSNCYVPINVIKYLIKLFASSKLKHILAQFPCCHNFIKILNSKAVNFTQLKNLIQRVGGSDMPSFMRAAIKSVISDKLAVNLTWRGTPTKPSIQNFVSFKIIKDICNLKYTHCTITDINRVCQQHVLHARDRLISRKNKN